MNMSSLGFHHRGMRPVQRGAAVRVSLPLISCHVGPGRMKSAHRVLGFPFQTSRLDLYEVPIRRPCFLSRIPMPFLSTNHLWPAAPFVVSVQLRTDHFDLRAGRGIDQCVWPHGRQSAGRLAVLAVMGVLFIAAVIACYSSMPSGSPAAKRCISASPLPRSPRWSPPRHHAARSTPCMIPSPRSAADPAHWNPRTLGRWQVCERKRGCPASDGKTSG